MAALFLTSASAVVVALNLHWVITFAASIVLAVAMGFNNAAVMKLIPVYVPQAVGGASGWVGGLGAFGGFVLPPVLGAIVSHYPENGFNLGFLVFTVLATANALVNYFGMVLPEKRAAVTA